MVTRVYDVIVIGAGPSGTSFAYNLKKRVPNLEILVIDKQEFPRYKPCGGGVSPEVQNYFDFDLTPAIDSTCNHVVMVANGLQIESRDFSLWMVRREKFDKYLLDKCTALGVEFIAKCEVVDIVQQTSLSLLKTSLGDFETKYTVIAEGGRGKLAKKLNLSIKNSIFAALEYEHYTQRTDNRLYIDFDYNDSGYAWSFPKSDGLSLGIGGIIKSQDKGKVGLPARLAKYTKQFAIDNLIKGNLHGHPILLYSGRQKLVHRNILLVGEIAGCVDPLTAEGIRPAIKSGFLAAKVMAYRFKYNKPAAIANYDRAFHDEIGKDFYYARIVAYFLNKKLTAILPLISHINAINGFMSVFSGQSNYRNKITFRRIIKMMYKSIL